MAAGTSWATATSPTRNKSEETIISVSVKPDSGSRMFPEATFMAFVSCIPRQDILTQPAPGGASHACVLPAGTTVTARNPLSLSPAKPM